MMKNGGFIYVCSGHYIMMKNGGLYMFVVVLYMFVVILYMFVVVKRGSYICL